MKIPSRINEISIMENCLPHGPYPPKGFVPFSEHELGNGDCFGLYWPFGKENEPPIVCEMMHDSWYINPAFSSLDYFLDKAAQNDEDESNYVESPSIDEDSNSPVALFEAARIAIKQDDVSGAIANLELSVSILPEYTNAWGLLAQQYQREKRLADAVNAVHRALLSPCCFGGINDNLLRWFQRQETTDEELLADPVWKRRQQFSFKYGGVKQNDDYQLFLQCIEEYENNGDGYKAVLLFQRYSGLMNGETTAFQERYGFTDNWFKEKQQHLFGDFLGNSRCWTSNTR